MKSDLVVGGGIAGLLAAIILKKKKPDHPVILIEQDEECGGLLRSIKKENGWEFDYGSHIVAQTGVPELDEILFAEVNPDLWHEMPILKSGGFFDGELYSKSRFPVLNAMSDENLHRAVYEIIECASKPKGKSKNLDEEMRQTFGNFLTNYHFGPIMKRQLGVALNELNNGANKLFGYIRFITGSNDMVRMLKTVPELDQVFAFGSYEEGVSPIMNYYPKSGVGIGLWVDDLVRQAEGLGVEVLTSTSLESCHVENGTLVQSTLSDGRELEIDEVVWTAPLFTLLKATGAAYESQYIPKIRKMKLFHFVMDQPFLTDCYHAYCNEPTMRSFRITLYSNIHNGGAPNGDYRCTVEMMVDNEELADSLIDTAWYELLEMGIVSPQAKKIAQYEENLANGFPVYTNEFVDELTRQQTFAKESFSNVHTLGKASANSFFMQDVLCEIYDALG